MGDELLAKGLDNNLPFPAYTFELERLPHGLQGEWWREIPLSSKAWVEKRANGSLKLVMRRSCR